jgi:carbonic anhydrase
MTNKLIEGFLKFRAEAYESLQGLMPQLVKSGQTPDYFIISCIDSRGNPGTIFRPEPGTFFAHKAMGAIVRPYKKGTALAAALQFALEYNNVKEIIILGHTGCGAIKALVEGLPDEEISSFVEVARAGLDEAKKRVSAEDTHHA